MAGKTDQIKGRAKEAAGDVTGDKRLRQQGKTDQVAGKVKEFLENARDKGEEFVDQIKEKINRARAK